MEFMVTIFSVHYVNK